MHCFSIKPLIVATAVVHWHLFDGYCAQDKCKVDYTITNLVIKCKDFSFVMNKFKLQKRILKLTNSLFIKASKCIPNYIFRVCAIQLLSKHCKEHGKINGSRGFIHHGFQVFICWVLALIRRKQKCHRIQSYKSQFFHFCTC